MTAQKLKEIIDSWNNESFEDLEGRLRIELIEKFDDSGARAYRLIEADPCHCGHATRLHQFPDQLKHSNSGQSLAVGAVLDNATLNQDLPVVVAVGINYMQFDTTKSKVALPANFAATRMWWPLGLVLERLDKDCLEGQIEAEFEKIWPHLDKQPKPFHLIAANYFPWATQSEWGTIGLNAIAESLVLRCWGYANPADRIARLIRLIAKAKPGDEMCVGEIPFVIFHKAKNAVAYLALETIRLLKGNFYSNYIFSDNLSSRRFRPVNAVLLLPQTPLSVTRGTTFGKVLDE